MSWLFRLFSYLPLWLLHAIGWVLGWLAYGLSSTYRQRFTENAALAGYSVAQVRGAIGHTGRMVAELPRLWMGAPIHYEWDNDAAVDKAYATGQGIVFLTPHMGCFEISAQSAAERYNERYGPMTVLYRPARQPWLAKVMASARNRPGLETAPTNLAGVRQMIRALRGGRAVGLLPDQVPPEGMGQWAPVFGRKAYTMTLAARLVQQTGATVLVAWAERLSWGGGFCIHVRELVQPLSSDLDTAVLQINQAMEQLIRECPQQYLWGYARYKQPRQEK
jgi:Kdo2-lipid IVA lauroyltransferase/acyltransferase